VLVTLDPAAAEELGDANLEVTFALNDADFAQLQSALAHVFSGRDYYRSVAA
jgi:hypothetical protein